jgi:IS30 family transposase
MRTYTQLTRGKRYQIRALLKAGISQSKMAFYLVSLAKILCEA